MKGIRYNLNLTFKNRKTSHLNSSSETRSLVSAPDHHPRGVWAINYPNVSHLSGSRTVKTQTQSITLLLCPPCRRRNNPVLKQQHRCVCPSTISRSRNFANCCQTASISYWTLSLFGRLYQIITRYDNVIWLFMFYVSYENCIIVGEIMHGCRQTYYTLHRHTFSRAHIIIMINTSEWVHKFCLIQFKF